MEGRAGVSYLEDMEDPTWEDFLQRDMSFLPLGFSKNMGSAESPKWGMDGGDVADDEQFHRERT